MQSHGVKAYKGNGNDINQVFEIVEKAIKYIKSNNAPAFIEFETFRWLEHCGPNWDDELGYREKNELDKWMKRCPIKRLEKKITLKGLINKNEIKKMEEKINIEIDSAFQYAKGSPFPNVEILNQHIYA